MQAGNGPA